MHTSGLYTALNRHQSVEFVSRGTFAFCDKPGGKASPADWGSFVSSLTKREVDVLSCVKNAPESGLTTQQIANALNVAKITVTGSLAGRLRKVIAKAGYEFEDVFVVVSTVNKERVYSAGQMLLGHDIGHPGALAHELLPASEEH
ncbi:hypothetical protein LCGC14_2377850, partial [marine sediment metagenome]